MNDKALKIILSLMAAGIVACILFYGCACSSTKGGSTSASERESTSNGGSSKSQHADSSVFVPSPSPGVTVTPAGIVITQHTESSDTQNANTETHSRDAAATQPSYSGGKGSGGAIGGSAETGFTIGGYSFSPTQGAGRAISTILFGLIMLVVAYFAMKGRQWVVAGACLALAIIAFIFPDYLVFVVIAGLGGAAYVVYRKHHTNQQLVAGTSDVLDHLKTMGGDVADRAKLLLSGAQDDATKAVVDEHKMGM